MNYRALALFLAAALCCQAGTYYVSPSGVAAWGAATNINTPCSLDTANQNVAAGDLVYLRGGTYTLAGGNSYDKGVAPQTTGTVGNVITYSAYNGEVPVFDGSGFAQHGIYLVNVSYVLIDGITISEINAGGNLDNADYCEIRNCTFGPRATEATQSGVFINGGSTHNWIHDCVFYGALSAGGPCTEAADIIRIGSGYSIGGADLENDYNTIEDNVLFRSAHTVLDNYGKFNVIRNNVMHNYPWIATCTTGQTGKETSYDTSATSLTIGTGSKTLTVSAGKSFPNGSPVGIVSTSSHANAMRGTVTSYSGTSLVVNVTGTSGSGTIASWTISRGNFPEYEDVDYDGMYGHRNLQLSDDYARDGTFVLVEGNRLGHASNNPGNGGPMNLDCAAPKNIVRHNMIFNGMSSGIYFKYATSDFYDLSKLLSTTSETVGTGSKTFTIATGMGLTTGQTIRVKNTDNVANAMTGTVTSYTSGTGVLVCNMTASAGSGTYTAWTITWNGGSGGVNNRIYNNTITNNGNGYNWRVYGHENVSYSGQGISQWNATGTGTTGNVIVNNIVYNNKEGAIGSLGLYNGDWTPNQVAVETWDTVSNNLTSDPGFANADFSFVDSLTLPDLSIGAGSAAKDNGAALTTVAVADTGSGTSLVVTDALFFQDGTWGSSLSNIQPDWIAVGTVGNTVQISSISYSTNTITLANSISRADGESVWLYKKSDGDIVLAGPAPDQGAFEYGVITGTLTTGTLTVGPAP